MTRRWPGSNPLWPEPATGITDIRIATGEAQATGEHKDWIEGHDPILRIGRTLAGSVDGKKRLMALDTAVQVRIDAAVKFALDSPLPTPETALDHVFA